MVFRSILCTAISLKNILVSNAGEVKLTDFGISRAAFQMEEQHRVIRGKYAYMAPEQVEGRVLDARNGSFCFNDCLVRNDYGTASFQTQR